MHGSNNLCFLGPMDIIQVIQLILKERFESVAFYIDAAIMCSVGISSLVVDGLLFTSLFFVNQLRNLSSNISAS